MIYPNSGSVNPFIIIENKSGEHLPMMNSDATEATGSLDQGDRETTVTTGVAGAEHKTRTGQQYTQIPRPHVEPALAEVGQTSRTCNRSNSNVAYRATAEIEMENGNVTVADRRHKMAVCQPEALKGVLCESPPEIVTNDVIRVSPMESTLITDVWTDHPTLIPVTGVHEHCNMFALKVKYDPRVTF